MLKRDTIQTMQSYNRLYGFTLIELSIVLVIIGLIVGGVLVGQDLIKAAQMRSQITQLSQLDTAANSFHSKFNGIPGDYINPGSIISGVQNASPTTTGEGNGNGQIESDNLNGDVNGGVSGEQVMFFSELSATGNIFSTPITTADFGNGSPTQISSSVLPPSNLGQGVYVSVGTAGQSNYYLLAKYSGTISIPVVAAGLTAGQALQLDSKLDDGNPTTGIVFSTLQSTGDPGTSSGAVPSGGGSPPSSTNCYDSGAHAYGAVNLNKAVCTLAIKTGF